MKKYIEFLLENVKKENYKKEKIAKYGNNRPINAKNVFKKKYSKSTSTTTDKLVNNKHVDVLSTTKDSTSVSSGNMNNTTKDSTFSQEIKNAYDELDNFYRNLKISLKKSIEISKRNPDEVEKKNSEQLQSKQEKNKESTQKVDAV